MHESDIRKQCKLTWALNHGDLSPHTEMGTPPKTKGKVRVDRRGRVSMKKPADMSGEEWKEVKAELVAYQKYARALVVRGGDSGGAHSNLGKIARGLEAGAVLAGIDAGGRDVKLWTYLAYKDDPIEHKTRAFKLLASIICQQYMAKRSLDESHYKRVILISLYQLNAMIHQYDKKFPKPTSEGLGAYKRPRDFKYRHRSIFADIHETIKALDNKAREGAR